MTWRVNIIMCMPKVIKNLSFRSIIPVYCKSAAVSNHGDRSTTYKKKLCHVEIATYNPTTYNTIYSWVYRKYGQPQHAWVSPTVSIPLQVSV